MHALVGQNGSGKSTLIKVLSGYHQPDEGASAWADGEPLTLGDGTAAGAAGIRFVHQDLGLVGTLNAVENIALTAGYQTGFGRHIRWRDEIRATRESLNVLGLEHVDVKAPINDLPPSQRTTVAIARALVGWEQGANLLVLDEPTATLPGDDVHRLFEVVHRLKERGVSIIYVSHHLDEVFELADRVTVLRDGKLVATVPVSELDHMRLVELIVGHHVEIPDPRRAARGRSTDVPGPRPARWQRARDRPRRLCRRDRRARRHHRLRPRARAAVARRADPPRRRRRHARRRRDRQLPTAAGDRCRGRLRARRARRARHGPADERAREHDDHRRGAGTSRAAGCARARSSTRRRAGSIVSRSRRRRRSR